MPGTHCSRAYSQGEPSGEVFFQESQQRTRGFCYGLRRLRWEAMGKILRKPIPLELLALEAGLALAGNGDLCS
jgi:hypothetical protein